MKKFVFIIFLLVFSACKSIKLEDTIRATDKIIIPLLNTDFFSKKTLYKQDTCYYTYYIGDTIYNRIFVYDTICNKIILYDTIKEKLNYWIEENYKIDTTIKKDITEKGFELPWYTLLFFSLLIISIIMNVIVNIYYKNSIL